MIEETKELLHFVAVGDVKAVCGKSITKWLNRPADEWPFVVGTLKNWNARSVRVGKRCDGCIIAVRERTSEARSGVLYRRDP